MRLYLGEWPRGSNGAHSTLHRILIFHSATHNQTRPLWCWFPSGWACARPRCLWVSLTTSPVRLGVSPAAAPTPMGVFNHRFEALFPGAVALGCAVCFAPRRSSGLSMLLWGCGLLPALCLPRSPPLRVRPSGFICANVWPQGLLVLGLPAPFVPHSASLGPATATRVLSTPVPVSAPPTSLDECLFFISLVSEPLAVRFSVSSGGARRHSVSTYATILVPREFFKVVFLTCSKIFPQFKNPTYYNFLQKALLILCAKSYQTSYKSYQNSS